MAIKTIEGNFTANKGNFAIVVGRWNSFVVESLLSAAIDTLQRHGIADNKITVVRAPGAFEIPLVCQKVAEQKKFDAIIALGAVIRGGTPHFEYVAGECTQRSGAGDDGIRRAGCIRRADRRHDRTGD